MRIFVISVATMLFVACAHAQEYFKWVDADGVTHYGEILPSPETEYETLEVPGQYTNANSGND